MKLANSTADLDDGYEAHLANARPDSAKACPSRTFLPRGRSDLSRMCPGKLQFNEALKTRVQSHGRRSHSHTQARLKQAGIETLADVRAHRDRLRLQPRSGASASRSRLPSYRKSLLQPLAGGEKDTPNASSPNCSPSGEQPLSLAGTTTRRKRNRIPAPRSLRLHRRQ